MPILSQISLPWQPEKVRVKFCLQHLMAQPRRSLCGDKDLADISYRIWVIAHVVPNFVAMATMEGMG